MHVVAVAALAFTSGPAGAPSPLEEPARIVERATEIQLAAPPPVWRAPRRATSPQQPRSKSPAAPPVTRERFDLAKQRSPERQAPASAQVHSSAAPRLAQEAPVAPEAPAPHLAIEVGGPRIRDAGFSSVAAKQERLRKSVAAKTGAFGASQALQGSGQEVAVTTGGFSHAARADAGSSRSPETVGVGGFGAVAQASAAPGPARAGRVGAFSAVETGQASAHERTTKAGGFGTAERGEARPRPEREAQAAARALKILSKPKPVYTAKAREERVEGEVAVRVRFSATGSVDVLEIVSGLGYGLDEAAAEAARAIRFEPAEQDGRPVDVTATIRIVFQMA